MSETASLEAESMLNAMSDDLKVSSKLGVKSFQDISVISFCFLPYASLILPESHTCMIFFSCCRILMRFVPPLALSSYDCSLVK
jgi:hypothetical protein